MGGRAIFHAGSGALFNRTAKFTVVSCRKDAPVFGEEAPADSWYEVHSGVVRTCRYLPDGHRQVTGFFFPGDLIGVDGPTRRAAAEAVTAVVLHRYDHRLLDFAAERDEDDASLVDRVLKHALRSAEDRVALLGLRSAAERVAGFLISMSLKAGPDGNIELPMCRLDIADHLALTTETVSRTLSQFARRRFIGFFGPQKVRILDRQELEDLAGGPLPVAAEGREARERTSYAGDRPRAVMAMAVDEQPVWTRRSPQ